MIGTHQLHAAQRERESRVATQNENAGRFAYSMHHVESFGVGDFQLDEPVMFRMPFLERPHFTQGSTVVKRPAESGWNIPAGSCVVWQWHRNTKGHYIGAYVALQVVLTRSDGSWPSAYPTDVAMIHDLVFAGVGIKDVGPQATTLAQVTGPRKVGFGGN